MSLERLSDEAQDDLLARGYSRRQLGRIAMVFGIGAATAAVAGRPAWAADEDTPRPVTDAKIRIGYNECWTGPFTAGQAASAAIIASCNRYAPRDERGDFLRAVMKVEGVPADQIVRLARLRQADMLVIGTHGRTGFSRLFLGSVAARVVATARCPVLTVRSPR